MGSPAGFSASLELDELQNVIDVGSGARTVAVRQANAQYNLGLNGTTSAMTLGTVKASSIVTVDANKDVSSFRNVVAVNFDAGADAVAGTIDVFPTTTATGKLQIAATSNSGAYNIIITNAAYGQAATLTIPDVGSATGAFVMDKGTSTISGAKTFTGGVVVSTSGVTVTDVDVALSATTGTKIGTAVSQKLAFWNATPVIQQASASQAAISTTVGSAVAATAATNTSPYGYAQAQADAIVTNVNALRVDLLAMNTLLTRLRLDLVTTGVIKGAA